MKKITIYSNEYWIKRGFSEEEATKKVIYAKKETSCFNKEFWIKRGFSEEEAIEKVKEKQSNNAKKRSKESYENMLMPWMEEYWIKQGFSNETAIENAKTKRNSMSINSLDEQKQKEIKEKRKTTFYSKSDLEIATINLSKGRTKEQLIQKFGEDYVKSLSNERGKGRRNSFFRRYSKVSNEFFKELQQHINEILLYGDNEKWIRYNSNKGFYVDCLLNNKIIEFNGDFYHANPKLYEENSKIIISKKNIKIAQDIWKKDEFKIKTLKKLGYEILIIWEYDININREKIINNCIKFLHNE